MRLHHVPIYIFVFDSCAVAWRGGGLALARGASAPFFFGTQFAVQNRRKSLLPKDLGRRGPSHRRKSLHHKGLRKFISANIIPFKIIIFTPLQYRYVCAIIYMRNEHGSSCCQGRVSDSKHHRVVPKRP